MCQCQALPSLAPPPRPPPRRRAFLIRGLENTLTKFLLSLEFYDEVGRQKIAISEWHALAVPICLAKWLASAAASR